MYKRQLTNLADGGHLCTGHHHDIHLGGAHLIRGPNGWTYTAPNGTTHTDTGRHPPRE